MAAPRVLIVHPDPWPRALMRIELRELGYDAACAGSLPDALVYRGTSDRLSPVGLIILDQRVLGANAPDLLSTLTSRHGSPRILLLTRNGGGIPPGPWHAVVHGDGDVPQILSEVERLLPPPDMAADD